MQVISEIKALPPCDRARVAEFMRQLEAEPAAAKADDPSFDAIADRIFGRHDELFRKLAQ